MCYSMLFWHMRAQWALLYITIYINNAILYMRTCATIYWEILCIHVHCTRGPDAFSCQCLFPSRWCAWLMELDPKICQGKFKIMYSKLRGMSLWHWRFCLEAVLDQSCADPSLQFKMFKSLQFPQGSKRFQIWFPQAIQEPQHFKMRSNTVPFLHGSLDWITHAAPMHL